MFSMRPLLLIGLIIVRNAYTKIAVHDVELFLNAQFTVIEPRCGVSEGPHWDEVSQLLYWVCTTNTSIHSYCPVTGEVNIAAIDTDSTPPTVVAPLKNSKGSLIVGIENWIGLVEWDGRSNTMLKATKIRDLEPNKRARFNDGKVDPGNRLWVGSMGRQTQSNPAQYYEDAGSLYMVDHDGSVYKKVSPLQMSNGLDWSPKVDKMYLVDSLKYCVYEYKYNITDGSICNPKVVFDFAAYGLLDIMDSLPDGLTVDKDGMLWVTVYATPMVVRINPHTGKLLAILVLQGVKQATSVAWGGPKLDILFVTTAEVDFDDEMRHKYSNSGKLIRVEGLGVVGLRPGTPAVLHWKE